jgi:hypothetical protein
VAVAALDKLVRTTPPHHLVMEEMALPVQSQDHLYITVAVAAAVYIPVDWLRRVLAVWVAARVVQKQPV